MADNNNVIWKETDRAGGAIIDEFDENEVNEKRSQGLTLERINNNGTISEMIDTINSNFLELAQHGGGPSGNDGADGINGEDGVNVQYIYALCDEMNPNTHYPTSDQGKYALFKAVKTNGSKDFNGVIWTDHAQPISKEHKNEYVFSRYRRNVNTDEDTVTSWNYDSSPILWAHWGETGQDGDGVEYIFMTSNVELTDSELMQKLPKKSSMDNYQKAIFNINDFYPGSDWFSNPANKAKVKQEYQRLGLEMSDSTFVTRWANKFGLTANGEWTDDPSGVGPTKQWEYVSIRRSRMDENDQKEWGDYSTPALWSNYVFEGRIFIIYCNTPKNSRPEAPATGSGWWDVENDRLIFNPSVEGASAIPSGWTDNNSNPDDGEISWMSSGIFDHSGKNLSWSNPVCISGKDGKNGEDGTTIEFIYALSENPNYPRARAQKETLFNDVEGDTAHNPKYSTYNGTKWYDRAQPISKENPTEYMWARRREKQTDPWEYDQEPVIWSHWGEDGTDGDGVEYIFTVTSAEDPSNLILPKLSTMSDDQKKIFQIDDFVPSREWFKKAKSKTKAQEVLGAAFDLTKWNNYYNFVLTTGWRDDPVPVDPLTPYQWVSIRRSTADEISGKRVWEDFSDPVLWNSYGKSTRVFIIYCNMPVDEEHPDKEIPNKPVDGTGVWVNTEGRNYLSLNDVLDALTGVTDEQRELNIGVWNDKNLDVRNTITWMCSGIFTEDGCNVSWSEPFRISGEKGEPGEDGDNMEYVYCLSDTKPSFPAPSSNMSDAQYDLICSFFHNIENAKNADIYHPDSAVNEGLDIANIHLDENHVAYYEYTDGNGITCWYDNPQSVDEVAGKRTEWVWLRTKAFDNPRWEFINEPTIWSHWGEDGTDGDGVEYIFHLSTHEQCPVIEYPPVKPTNGVTNRDKCKEAIYNIRDFYPHKRWFQADTDGDGKVDGKEDAKAAIVDGGILSEGEFNDLWNTEVDQNRFFDFDYDWTDDPQETDFFHPFQFVSIRKSYTNADGKKEWGPYGTPKLWSRHLIQSRVFMVYCNIPIVPNEEEREDGEIIVPTAPDLDYGWWDGDDRLFAAQPEEGASGEPYAAPAYNSETYNPQNPGTPISTWSDTDEDVENNITWICSITFAENGMAIGCSEPFRITGARGYRGVDGADIEFIYARCDEEADLKYPKPGVATHTQIMKFFDNIENSTNLEDGRKYYDYPATGTNKTRWYDNPMGVAAESTKTKEWVWSRSKSRGTTLNPTPDWTYPTKPSIWSHWGEDGTDGDGVEYIFMLSETKTYPKDQTTWNSYWTNNFQNDTAKAVYSMDDFVPNSSWFTPANMDAVCDKMNNEGLGTWNQTHFNNLKTVFTNWQGGTWTDNPGDVTPQIKYQFVSIRRYQSVDDVEKDKKWGPFSYPTIWSTYSNEKFTSFAFTATETDVDLSNIRPQGGSFDHPVPNQIIVNSNPYDWTDGPQPDAEHGKVIIWMTSASIKENDTTSPDWSTPKKMVDESGFQVEWTTAQEIIPSQKQAIEGDDYNFETYMKSNSYNEDAAERAWRTAVNSGVGVQFSDDATNAIYMATCFVKNSVWTNWTIAKVKGEQGKTGPRGPQGISINEVKEYFHADTSISPTFTSYTDGVETLPNNFTSTWHAKSAVVGSSGSYSWNKTRRYLFNIEVIKRSDDKYYFLDPHYVAVFADGIKDVVDYYILDTDGSSAPHISNGTPVTSGTASTEGTSWWTTNASKTKISADNQYLWNISKKVYEDGNTSWTTPMVIGIFNIGEQGENAIYLDLDNEMDVIQIDNKKKVITAKTFNAILTLYNGSTRMNIKKVQVSGEEAFGNKFKLYKSTDGTNWTTYTDNTTLSSGVPYIKMTLTFSVGDVISSEYSKIQFIVTPDSDNTELTANRTISYTLVGTTNPSIYSIALSSNVIIKKENGTYDPTQLELAVVKITGNKREIFTSTQTGEGGFKLYLNNTAMSSYTISTSSYNIGDKLTFRLEVDTDDADTTPDTVMDTETVFVIGEGQGYDDGWLKKLLGGTTDISGALVMTGDLLARRSDGKITAGVMGHDYTTVSAENIRFFAGNTDISNLSDSTASSFISKVKATPFRVTEAGKLYATDVSITGAITATSLFIGGTNLATSTGATNWINQYVDTSDYDDSWLTTALSKTSIAGGLLTTGNIFTKNSSNKITAGMMGYDTTASDDIRFFAGTTMNSTFNNSQVMTSAKNAPFRVTEAGKLYATNASITGSITATSLYIGGNNLVTNSGAQAFIDSKGIKLNADRINLNAAHQLNLTAGTFTINSDNLTVDSTGLTLRSKNGNTTIDSDGILHAAGAVISGIVTANEFLANGTGKQTTITGNDFEIKSTTGNRNSIFISIETSVSDGGRTFNNVPTLCMMYEGKKYVLSPLSWLDSNQDSSRMGFDVVASLKPYKIASSLSGKSGTATGTTNGTISYVWFKSGTNNISNPNTTPDTLYRFNVVDLGNSNTMSTNASAISSALLATTTTNMSTINNTAAYTWADAHQYESKTTPITTTYCTTFNGLLKDSWIANNNGDSLGVVSNAKPKHSADDGASITTNYGLNKFYDLIVKYTGLTTTNTASWTDGNNNVSFTQDQSSNEPYKYFPFSYNGGTAGSSFNNSSSFIESNVYAYPILTMTNKGKTFSDTDKIWVTCDVTLQLTGGSCSAHILYEDPFSHTYTDEYNTITYLNIKLSFNLILTLSTKISVSNYDVDDLKTKALAAVDSFFKKLNDYDNSSIRSNIDVVGTMAINNYAKTFTLNRLAS